MSTWNNSAERPSRPDTRNIPESPEFSSSPEEIKRYIRRLHESEEAIDKKGIDTLLLGNASTEFDRELWYEPGHGRIPRSEINDRYPNEKPWNGSNETIWTPYELARGLVTDLRLGESDTFYDLGAGYGRLVLYAGITSVARCVGIEMVSERVKRARAAIERLGIENASYVEGKVQDQDFSDGDVFYMYSPFSEETFNLVFDRLEEISSQKPITIINRGSNVEYAMRKGRLRNLRFVKRSTAGFRGVSFFETPDIANTPDSKVIKPDSREDQRANCELFHIPFHG